MGPSDTAIFPEQTSLTGGGPRSGLPKLWLCTVLPLIAVSPALSTDWVGIELAWRTHTAHHNSLPQAAYAKLFSGRSPAPPFPLVTLRITVTESG